MFMCEHIHASVAQGCLVLSRFGAGETGGVSQSFWIDQTYQIPYGLKIIEKKEIPS